MKIMTVVGARPNFMKAAPVVFAIRDHNSGFAAQSPDDALEIIEHVLVHTGQHYDGAMSGSFFSDLGLPTPDVHLEVGSASHAVQTAEIMRRFEEVLLAEKPDAVVVLGDVNSTVACALVASKIALGASGTRPLIAHVEAGLRSFDASMPEEINRVITDHLADLLFVTEESGVRNLRREGIAPEKIHFVGNTMIDSLLASLERAEKSAVLDRFGLRSSSEPSPDNIRRYALLTLHRPSNVDNQKTFLSILEGLEELSSSCPILFSAHPRTRKRIEEFGLERFFRASGEAGIRLLDPLGYLDFLCLMRHAALVVTDSGGIQEETTCLGVPCVTVRENTERPVTVTCGTNIIAGTSQEKIRSAVNEQLSARKHAGIPEKWDGKAAGRIVEAIVREFAQRK
jgi:UDP-N-acetylglucosamine 2-epimerase (non-hydrolysing)